MTKGILGKKIGMTQIFTPEGRAIPVTVIEAGPCFVVQKKTSANDGYDAIQLGFGDKKERLTNKPMLGHFAKANVKPAKILREFKVDASENYDLGQEIKADIFSEGEYVDVTGTSKGKGFAGVIKRWNFNRAPMAHGSMYHRRPGSLCATDPARVFKGRKLPGRLGGVKTTTQGLQIAKVDSNRNLLLIKGAIPGANGSFVVVRKTVKRAKQ
ncbi:LSU ribosomal protein L3P [Hydrogenispora ethanolica]|jgi:large subunit ribosomal protein L3|uniref:Large ribosomal subunit protein uL3 n=1 Tax=Hydrogenispora ethanolica TaxID=1082276 RepID=A0A4R1RKU3_HYDET|nr:50S ribosomal protein L3 [Hydrogenispora ethanolica]TCL66460.1 LSU ribosomal protein L3P [Hydrogenispora ethanolica]